MDISAWMLLLLGPIIGSWLGVIIRRWPVGEDFIHGRSRCDACGARLSVIDLVPIVSFIALRGRCRRCGAWIGWFPLAVELAALCVGAAALVADGATPAAWIDAVLGWALLLAAWIDAETLMLPDLVTLPLVVAGLAVTGWQSPGLLYNHAAAAALGYCGCRVLNFCYASLRGRDGLGEGDAKLLAAGGAWLGVDDLPTLIFAAAVLGIACYGLAPFAGSTWRRDQKLPFGPPLALAFLGLRLIGW